MPVVTGTEEHCRPDQVTAPTAPATSGSVGSRQPEQSRFLSIEKNLLLVHWKHNHIDDMFDICVF